MSRIRIYPGTVTASTIRGLILADDAAAPTLTASAGAANVAAVPVPALLAAHLGSVRPWRFVVTGLPGAQAHALRAESAGASHEVRFRTLDPAASSLKVVVASCFYEEFGHAAPYASLLRGVHCRDAAFKLLIGDNLYLDVHSRQRDESLEDGWEETAYVYLKYFWDSAAYADVLSLLPTVTTWDDHEFWNNYPEQQSWLSRSRGALRPGYVAAALACLDIFQAPLNPPPVVPGSRSFTLPEMPLVDFFVADLRSQRGLRGSGGTMMPGTVLAALATWAGNLTRPGVLVLGQPLVVGAGGSTDFNPPAFEAEYAAIWRALEASPWDILVVSGDVHHSRALELTLPGGRRIFEVVTSAASHIPSTWAVVLGSFNSQGQDAVEFPDRVRYGSGSATLSRYFFGTDASASISTLTFTQTGGGAVDVGCTFLDLKAQAPAASTRANRGFFTAGRPPEHPTCSSDKLFKLSRR